MSAPAYYATVPLVEALAMVSEDDPLEIMFEPRPNVGVTHHMTFPRAEVIDLLTRAPRIGASGPTATGWGFAIHVELHTGKFGDGLLFIRTRGEKRVAFAQDAAARGGLN